MAALKMENRGNYSIKLILASGSPRRREILAGLGADLIVMPSQINEDILAGENAEDYVLRLARDKACDIARNFSDGLVIGADTTVVLEQQILGKPKNREDARRMIVLLAGKWHEVLTGLSVIDAASARAESEICRTRVKFCPLSAAEIEWYLNTDEPFDKAGAYAIQGYGSIFVEQIEGNYLNVVGLPVTLLRLLLQRLGGDLININ
jgi:septum formation protein